MQLVVFCLGAPTANIVYNENNQAEKERIRALIRPVRYETGIKKEG